MNKNNIKFIILAVISIIMFSIALSPVTLQNDTFYTIKLGEHILKEGMTPIDSFTWHEEIPYTYPHWLYDVLIYLIYNAGGYLGIYISTIVFSCMLGLVLFYSNSKLTKNYLTSFVITIGAMYLMKEYIAARAQLITFILFVITLFCIEMFLTSRKKRYALSLILISFIITNMHAAVWPFFFILFLPYIGEYIWCVLDQTIKKNREKREKLRENPYKLQAEKTDATKWLFLIIAICLVLALFTSFGDNPYTHLYKLTKGNSTASINEHMPTVLINQAGLLCVIIMFLGILICTDTKIRLRDLLMLGGLLLLTLISKRQMSMLVLIGSFILNRLICNFLDKYDPDGTNKATGYITTWVGEIIVLVIITYMSFVFIRPKLKDEFVNTKSYPVEATKFIKENLDVDNIRLYNEYNYGSYLLLNDVKVFIDSRCDLYTKEFNGKEDIFSDFIDVSNINKHYEEIFKKYDFTHVMMYKNAKLNLFIKRDKNYKEIYEDTNFVIYERNISN